MIIDPETEKTIEVIDDIGYDFILSNTPTKINYKLIDILTSWVKNRYAFSMDEVRKYTASLYFSLIPLHNDEKCQQYYQVAQQQLMLLISLH